MIVVKVADVPLAMGISAAVGGRAVIADELDNLTALSPYSLRWLPFFNPLILGLYFPFLRATVAAEADRRQGRIGQEIGRASCRERVCTYVEISVVAVPIKK